MPNSASLNTVSLKPELLSLLVCPDSRQALTLAGEQTLTAINERIAARQLRNRAGELLTHPLTAALIRADQLLIYPIKDGIPLLLADEGIEIIRS